MADTVNPYVYFLPPVRHSLFIASKGISKMIFFLEYFLLVTALGVFIWVLKVHLFHVTPIVMQPLEIHENSVKQNIVNDTNIENAYDHNELLKNDHLGPKEKDMLYESSDGLSNRLSGKCSTQSDEFGNMWHKIIDNHVKIDETVNNTNLQLETSEDPELSITIESDDESLEKNDEEITNVKNITASSSFSSTNNEIQENVIHYDILDSNDDKPYIRTNSGQSFFVDSLDFSKLYSTYKNELTGDDYKNPEVIKKTYFTDKEYKTKMFISNEINDVEENIESFTDLINLLSSTEDGIDTNSSFDYTESLPSTIYSSENSLDDTKYVEDITGIVFCKSDKPDKLNDAFIGE